MAGVVGLEPTNAGVKVPCLNRLGYTPITPGANGICAIINQMAPRAGLEPATT